MGGCKGKFHFQYSC